MNFMALFYRASILAVATMSLCQMFNIDAWAIDGKTPSCPIAYLKKNNLYLEFDIGENIDFRFVTNQLSSFTSHLFLKKDWLFPMLGSEPGIPIEPISTGVTQISEQTFLKDDSLYWVHAPRSIQRVDDRFVYDYITNGVTHISGRSFLKGNDLYRLRNKDGRLEYTYITSDVQTINGSIFLKGDSLYKIRENDFGYITDYLTTDFTQYGNTFLLKGGDLYLISSTSFGTQITWITSGVSSAVDGAFLKKDSLYIFKKSSFFPPPYDYVTNGVAAISNLCDLF